VISTRHESAYIIDALGPVDKDCDPYGADDEDGYDGEFDEWGESVGQREKYNLSASPLPLIHDDASTLGQTCTSTLSFNADSPRHATLALAEFPSSYSISSFVLPNLLYASVGESWAIYDGAPIPSVARRGLFGSGKPEA